MKKIVILAVFIVLQFVQKGNSQVSTFDAARSIVGDRNCDRQCDERDWKDFDFNKDGVGDPSDILDFSNFLTSAGLMAEARFLFGFWEDGTMLLDTKDGQKILIKRDRTVFTYDGTNKFLEIVVSDYGLRNILVFLANKKMLILKPDYSIFEYEGIREFAWDRGSKRINDIEWVEVFYTDYDHKREILISNDWVVKSSK